MEQWPLVLHISSDDEEEEGKASLEEKGERSIDLDWINEFLDMSNEEPNKVIMANKSQHKSKSSTSTTLAVKSVDNNDDCVVLDGNQKNRVNSVDDSPTGSDKLVVGFKGSATREALKHKSMDGVLIMCDIDKGKQCIPAKISNNSTPCTRPCEDSLRRYVQFANESHIQELLAVSNTNRGNDNNDGWKVLTLDNGVEISKHRSVPLML